MSLQANPELQTLLGVAFAQYKTDQGKINAIDSVLRALTAAADVLKAERNAIAPIHSLPNELLADIFYHVHSPPLTSLIIVCRRWHKIAQHTPRLYDHLEFDWIIKRERFQRQLQLSGGVPLVVTIGRLDPSNSTRAIPQLMLNAGRLARLNIGASLSVMVELIDNISRHDFPALFDLQLSVARIGDELDESGSIKPIPLLPSQVLDIRIPRLRRLDLADVEPPWTAIHSLQSLKLSATPQVSLTNPLEFNDLLQVLSACPGLTYVYLRLPIIIAAEQYSSVYLPHLEFLHIQGLPTVRSLQRFLLHVIFPATTSLDVDCPGVSSGNDIRDILVPVHKRLRTVDAPVARSITFQLSEPYPGHIRPLTVSTSTEANRWKERARAASLIFCISTYPTTQPHTRQVLAKILNAVPTATITHLFLGNRFFSTYLSKSAWRTVLPGLPAIECVDLNAGEGSTPFCAALAALVRASRPPFPLRKIKLSIMYRGDDEIGSIERFVDALREMLQEFLDADRRVAKLKIKASLYHEVESEGVDGRIDELRGLVGSLDVKQGW
ncbi:UPF0538 protein C2C4.04c [Mycena indigotica]|uniref:UPF0538 protein C2C4.04c n=1 Tax=Mycena indigotica TaxID=2126181 RepID=A0A8H6SQT1_9AGAR|nr:UPF0538 protein C2C4.04c [Mycena indigotica]KAF7303503.1 UPF0538 protein C2C4.04c [Mycena indigotica]